MKLTSLRLKRGFRALAILAPALALTGCLNMEPKVLGQQGLLDFSAFNGSGSQSSFLFNFALYTPANTAVTPNTKPNVQIQGSNVSQAAVLGNCNLSGTSCQCNFYGTGGNLLGSTDSTQITYDEPGNYLTCTVPDSVPGASIASVTVSSINGSVASAMITVSTSTAPPSIGQLIGSNLDVNRVRTVYRYQCEFDYLQKVGTSEAGFDCTNQTTNVTTPLTSCDPLNPNTNADHFCILKAKVPFFLFSDTYSNNFTSKIADKIYGGGTTPMCGMSIKQVNCVGTDSDPNFGTAVKKFGLYGQATGIWQTAVSLPSGPNQAASTFGFAAAVSTLSGNCPPGLTKEIFYTATLNGGTTITPATNVPQTQTLTEVADVTTPATVPAAFQWAKTVDGSCNGTSCLLPLNPLPDVSASSSTITGLPTAPYSSGTFTPFCVIPVTALTQ